MENDTIETKTEGSGTPRRDDAATVLSADGAARAGAAVLDQANEALHGVRGAIDRASHSVREFARTGEEWAKDAEGRAVELGKGLRGRGERAVDGITRQVEQNPLTSIAVAFALGVVCAIIARR